MYETLELDIQKQTAWIHLNRPEARNALNLQMLSDLQECLDGIFENEAVHHVVLTGKGSAFCAGADLKEMLEPDPKKPAFGQELSNTLQKINHGPKPVIAMVNGPTIGGGVGLMCAADIAVVSEEVFFRFSEVHLGLIPAVISHFVLRRLHPAQARRLMLSGEKFSATQALQWGLIQEVTSADSLLATTQTLLQSLSKAGPEALKACKALLDFIPEHSESQNLEYASQTLHQLMQGPEAQERINRFFKKM